ncbi:MAG: Ig-like domain-containing protein, partial [Patescibacteria group bacterium]
MQVDTFPPEVALVTNATLTSGTFALNDFAAFRPLQITKFATPTATGVIGATNVGIGDLVVANTSANPASVKYNWHIASTSAAINNTALRLDDAPSAPTYAANSSFSRLMPTATTTINAFQLLTATTTLTAGDLVFAKVIAGADNLNTYAWHVVTATEALTAAPPLGAAGTTTILRLDSFAIAPTFAASSVLAKISSAANGAIDGAVAQDATSFSFGDIVFSKATAFAANAGSYAFHIVSNGATGATSTVLRLDNSASNLQSSTPYLVTATTAVKDAAGNPLAANATVSFTTGATGGTNTTPPFVQTSQPQAGNQSHAPNAPIKLVFSVAMEAVSTSGANSVTNTAVVKLSTDVNGAPGVATSTTNSYDSTTNTVTITPTANLAVNTSFVVQVTTDAKSSTGTSLPGEYRLYFRTAAAVDSTAPTILGVSPANASVGVSMGPVLTAGFSKDLNASTVTTNTVTLVTTSGNSPITGVVTYSPNSRSASFVPSTALSANTGYSFVVVGGASGVKDLANNALASSATTTFTTTATADTTDPFVTFASADNFGIAITFSEPMKTGGSPNAADNIANYTLESPVGSTISLGGKTVAYDAGAKTARITGMALQNGNTFKVTIATPVQDLASRSISTAGTPAGNLAFGTVQNSTATGGLLGPGTGLMQDPGLQGMSPVRVVPGVKSAGATAGYSVEFPVTTSIPLGGSIVLTFPSGFDVTNAAAATAGTESFRNGDINGPSANTVTIASVTNNASAGTVTIVTAGAATGANTFISFDLKGIVNSTIPNSTGYTVDIKTRDISASPNNSAVLETKTSAPFFLGVTGAITLLVEVFHDDNGNSTKDSGEEVTGARVFLFSPAQGGLGTTTPATGIATFNSLSSGDYMLGIDPASVGSFAINAAPQPINITANATKKYILGAAGSTITIAGTVTGPNGTSVDVFAGSQSGFSKTTIALTNSAVNYTLPISANTTYQVGVGPSIPSTFLAPGAPPPPPPTFTFMPPPSITVTATTTSITGKNFVLSATSKTIAGFVRDSGGTGVNGAGVFARPVSNTTSGGSSVGFGTGGQSGTDGSFTLNVVPGTYLVGVFKPGMPNVPDQQITVPSTGGNSPGSLTFKLNAGTSLTITGSVKDDGGNAIPYAGVSGRKVTSASDTTITGGGTQNFIGGQTDANGAYTLYVNAGTWVLEAYAPGFGRLGTKTVTVSTASLSGQDFSAATLSLGTITGQATKATVVQQGVMVRAEGSAGVNMSATDASGNYSLRVPAGTYTVTCIFQGIGEGTPITGVAVTANTTTPGQDCTVAAPITITVNLTDGTAAISNAFIDVRDSNGRGNGTSASTVSGANAVYVITVPPGTYTVRAGHPSFGPVGSTASVNTTRTITYSASAGALFAVTGSAQANGSALSGAWASLFGTPTGQTNPINVGTQTGSDGTFSLSVPAGSYRLRVDKPGYKLPAENIVTVAAATNAGVVTLTATTRTITGTVTLNGSPVSGAFVDGKESSGGFAVAQTGTDGTYSLAVDDGSWTLRAHSMGYEGGPTSVSVGGNNPGQNITLTAISGFTVKPERQETMTPSSGGLITNSDITGFKMNIPANALGTGSNAGTITTQTNTAIPTPSNGAVLSKNAVSIDVVDSSGQPIKNLNDSVIIVIPYTEADIPSGSSESNLVLGVWNDATQQYDTLPTTLDTVNNTLTATVTHFSDFAP